jgi:uncharacterized protein (TIGR02246 family)
MTHDVSAATPALSSALALGNAAAAAALYAADARLVTAGSAPLAGRDEIEAYWRAGIACGLRVVDLAADEVQVGRDTAIEIGRYRLELDGVADCGKYVAFHRRRPDGCWRRAVEVFNPDDRKEDAS